VCIAILGLSLGLIIVDCDRVGRILYPFLVASQIVPKVALGPVVLIILGFGIASKVVIGVLIAFFPAVMGTVLGLRSVAFEKRALFRTMGASWWRSLVKLRFPSALPNILSGIKLSAIYCVSGVVIAEFVGSDRGIGRTVLQASSIFNVEIVFAATAYVVLLGLAVFLLSNIIEHAILRLRGGPIV
jgi:NitT/TauT family transport system permease protein